MRLADCDNGQGRASSPRVDTAYRRAGQVARSLGGDEASVVYARVAWPRDETPERMATVSLWAALPTSFLCVAIEVDPVAGGLGESAIRAEARAWSSVNSIRLTRGAAPESVDRYEATLTVDDVSVASEPSDGAAVTDLYLACAGYAAR